MYKEIMKALIDNDINPQDLQLITNINPEDIKNGSINLSDLEHLAHYLGYRLSLIKK